LKGTFFIPKTNTGYVSDYYKNKGNKSPAPDEAVKNFSTSIEGGLEND
jgi:hypothetical protein